MKKINENHNSPEVFNRKFNETFGLSDMKRLWAMAKYYQGGTYVDVGCLDSPMPVILSERYPDSDIWGIDYADKVIEFLAPLFPKVHYVVGDAYYLPFADESVDYVVAGETIEHLEDPRTFVYEALRILKPGGWLSVSTPWEELYRQGSVGGDLHIWSYSESDIRELLSTDNVEIIQEIRTKSIIAWRQKEQQ
jgi:ubiquinone/menaquinone biosynthesis C-methylase UbiE